MQWDLIYSPGELTPAGTNFFTTGAAALAAGKLTSCNVVAPGDARCLVAGLDSNFIADGVLATVTFQILPSTTHTSSPVSFSGVEGADPSHACELYHSVARKRHPKRHSGRTCNLCSATCPLRAGRVGSPQSHDLLF